MANWRPVDVRLWNDRKFLACGDSARLLWLFLLTCPSLPIPGVILGGDAALSEQLGWTPERLRERFHELSQNGLRVRREPRLLWLPNGLKYQRPSNPNMVKGWARKWDDVPEGEIKCDLWEELRIACKSWSILFTKLFAKPFHDGSGNGLRNGSGNGSAHEHQHDHEHQHENDLGRAREASPSPPNPIQPKPTRATRRRIPDTWSPRPQERSLAANERLDADLEAGRFRDHHTAKGSLMADWDAAFRTWIGNAVRFANGTRNGMPTKTPIELQMERIAMLEAQERDENR